LFQILKGRLGEVNAGDWGAGEEDVGVAQEVLGVDADVAEEAAAESPAQQERPQRAEPFALVVEQERALAGPQVVGPRVVRRQALAPALKADEFGAGTVAVLVQPVGVHQPRRIVLGILEDGLKKGVGVSHGCLPRQYTRLRPYPSDEALRRRDDPPRGSGGAGGSPRPPGRRHHPRLD
jgi:hypothetical protein